MRCTNNKTKKKTKACISINTKGSAFGFIYGLAFLLVLVILYIIFSQVLNVYIYPTTLELTGGEVTEPTKWLKFWDFTPYIILFVVGLFLFFRLTSRDTTQGEQ